MLLPLYSRFEIQYDFSIKNLPEFDKGVCGMEGQKKRRPPVLFLMILVLFLTVGGLALAVQSFGRYDTLLLEQSDSQLYGLARSVDRSVSGALEQFIGELDYLIRLESFTNAEADCLAGQPEELLQLLQNNPLIREALITDFLCLQDGRVLLSASGRTGYTFPVGGSLDGRDRVRPCVAENGAVYLSFQLEGERGLWYAALVDLSLFYRQVAGGLTASPRDQILLLDAGGQVLLHQTGQEIRVELAADGLAGEPGLGFLLQCQREGQEGACFYEAESYTARMAVIPAAGNNGIFAVGVSEDFDQVSRPIRRSALLLTTGGGLVIAGVLLLAGLNLRSGRRNERAQRELALLQEKNAAMEALNRKNQELAHHDRLQTIGTLTSSIAHEFNNLLTPIMGYSILVLEQLPSDAEELYDNVLEIYNASRKAKEIIARLSDLSRKNTSLTFQYVSPDELVRKVLAVASPARPPHVEVRTDLACRHLWLRGNEIQLSQMLLNLILNAYHAMEPGGGTLTVATRPEGEFLCFQVSDTGSGISPEVLPHIFEPFFTTKERGKGTGLGLAIVRQVMEEHKGTIAIDTAPGRGTTMLLRFPTITPPEEDT